MTLEEYKIKYKNNTNVIFGKNYVLKPSGGFVFSRSATSKILSSGERELIRERFSKGTRTKQFKVYGENLIYIATHKK